MPDITYSISKAARGERNLTEASIILEAKGLGISSSGNSCYPLYPSFVGDAASIRANQEAFGVFVTSE